MRPPLPSVHLSRRARIAVWTVVVVIVLLIVAAKLTGVYINWLWFGQVGFGDVYSTTIWTRTILFAIFGVLMAAIIGGNMLLAYRLRPSFRPMSTEQQNLERYRAVLEPRARLILIVAMALSLLIAGMSAQGDWQAWQLWLNGDPFGIADPQFGMDVSFYAWDYPVYRIILNFGFTAIIFSIVLAVAVHYLTGAIRLQTPGPKVTMGARRHLTILVFVFMVLKACAYWLDRYGLVFSDRSGRFTGASYTDVHAALQSRTILFWIAIVLALGVLASLWMRSALFPGIGFIVLLVLSILINGIYPTIVQQVSVKPNASSKEYAYIQRNLDATRAAYGIQAETKDSPGQVDYQQYTPSASPSTSVLTAANDPTMSNVRILDPNVVSRTFAKFQQDGSVYGFADKLDVDRYTVKGQTHDYVVGVRELDAASLQDDQTNWINQHTNYTHGYGLVAAEADKDVTKDRNETGAFAAGGIPPTGVLPKLKNPGVYFGELLPDYAIVGAQGAPQEFDGDGKEKVTYAGGGGVSLSNFFTRLAFAINYKQPNFLLNDAASATGAKIILNRDPREMIQKVAPYLTVDSDPYPIIDQASGDVVWMVDGYTTLDSYPYSQRYSLSSLTDDSFSVADRTARQSGDTVNYIRNSVKATIDAYTGQVKLYAWDETDPVLKAWMGIFPGSVLPKESMPKSIREHVRYPQDMFKVQRALLGLYHVNDPVLFYNVGDKWTVPADPTAASAANQPPYYVLASPADGSSKQPMFQLTSPMNVNGRSYLAAYISVDSDPDDYGKITVLQLPRGSSAVQGPEQVFNNLASNPTITKDLSLFNAVGGASNVIHGNLLTLPIGNSFVYIEPLYNQSSSSGTGTYPSLQRIIVVYGGQVGYGETLAKALTDFLPGHETGQTLNLPDTETGGNETTPPTSTAPPPTSPTAPPSSSTSGPSGSTPPSAQRLLQQMSTAYADLQSAFTTGDAAKIGAAQQKVNDLVEQYLTRFGTKTSSAPATATPTAPK